MMVCKLFKSIFLHYFLSIVVLYVKSLTCNNAQQTIVNAGFAGCLPTIERYTCTIMGKIIFFTVKKINKNIC